MLTHDKIEGAAPNRVVVLGAGGFLGQELMAALAGVGIPALGLGRSDVDLSGTDAGQELASRLEPGDAVVVLSAITPDKGRDIGAFAANIRMGEAVCAAIAAVPPEHVVYLSSDAVYPLDIGLVTEGSCASGPDLYGVMHRAREVMVGTASPAPVALLRPTLVYGAADTHNSYGPNRLRRAAHSTGRIELFGEGEETRDHVFIDDVVALLLLVLRHRSAGTLNLATGRSVSYRALADLVAAQFDGEVDIVCHPRQNPVTHRHFDVAALHRAFPEFRFTPLEEGLARAHAGMVAAG